MVLWFVPAGLWAQTPSKTEEAVKKFSAQVERLKKAANAARQVVIESGPPKPCSIPLLRVPVDPKVDPGIKIEPKGDVRYQIREVVPPAPVCESVIWK